MIVRPSIGEIVRFGNPLSQGMTGCWTGMASGGDTVRDQSGRGRHGTDAGAAVIDKQGMLFDGTSTSYFDLGSDAWISTTEPFSIAARLYIESFTSYPGIISLKNNTAQTFLLLYSAAALYAPVVFGDQSNSFFRTRLGTSQFSAGSALTTKVWHDVVITSDGVDPSSTSSWTAYLNGLKASLTSAGNFASTTHSSRIGFEGSSAHNGRIDYVYLYDRVLSAAEATALHFDPFAIFRPTRKVFAFTGGGAPPATSVPVFSHHYSMLTGASR